MKTAKLILITLLVCLLSEVYAQPISLWKQHNGRMSFTMFGNTMNKEENNGTSACEINTSSSASLNLSPSETLVAAYLYWAGSGSGDFDVTFDGDSITPDRTFLTVFSGNPYFSAMKDITPTILAKGNGTYTLSDLDLETTIQGYCFNSTNFGGWAVVVVYEDPSLAFNTVNIYDGLQQISAQFQTLTINLNNIQVIDPAGAKLGFLAWEGDESLAVNETARINGNLLSSPVNPPTNNFNSTNSFTGNTDLYNMDLDFYDVGSFINTGDLVATIELTSGQDLVLINAVPLAINNELPDATVDIDNVAVECDDPEITVDFTVGNYQGQAILPEGTNIRFYVDDLNGAFLGESFTTQDIAIGESESLQISFSIPAGTPDPFTLFAVVNDDGSGNRIISELVIDNNDDSTVVDQIQDSFFNETVEICDTETYTFPDGTTGNISQTYTSTLTGANDDGCDSVIVTNLIVHPSYNQNIDAEICDNESYILPDGTEVNSAGTYTSAFTTNQGCDSIITTNLSINPTYSSSEELEICDSETYTLPDGTVVNTTGTYTSTLLSNSGCDSVIITNLTVHPSFFFNVENEICDGETFTLPDGTEVTTEGVYVSNLTTVNGCDSVISTNLIVHPVYSITETAEICDDDTYTLPDGTIVNTTGSYEVTLPTINNCDSIITTNLTVLPTYQITETAEICDNETYTLPDGTLVSTTGTFTTTLLTTEGCDSTITTNLTVHPTYFQSINDEICDNETYTLPDGSLVNTTGTYVNNFTTINGCDSVITVNLTVNPTYNSNETAVICDDELYTLPDGSQVNTTGTYTVTIPTSQGCDSTIITDLTVNPTYLENTTATICDNEEYTLPDGSMVNTTGTYSTTLITTNGCDSTIITDLTVFPTFFESIAAEICDGESYTLPDGTSVTTTGTYTSNFISANGCDSIISTQLVVNPTFEQDITAVICDNESYTLPSGTIVDTTGIYIDTLLTSSGCDSIINVDLTVNLTYNLTVNAEICDNETYSLPDGTNVSSAGTYTTNLLTANGCDSVITTELAVFQTYFIPVTATICENEEYTLPDGTIVSTSGTYATSFTSVNGCDSTISTQLVVNPTYDITTTAEICDDETYTLPDGSSVNTTGVYIVVLPTNTGCDSTISTDLTVHPTYDITEDISICNSSSYTLPDGTVVSSAGTYTSTLVSSTGCDSIINTNLSLNAEYFIPVNASLCEGDTYTLPDGTSTGSPGTYVFNLTSSDGCDSVVSIQLSIAPNYFETQDAQVCDGDSYTLPDGTLVSTTGTFTTTLLTTEGCDSIIETNLIVAPNISVEEDIIICAGQNYTLPDGTIVDTTGAYSVTLISSFGCDSTVTTNLTVQADFNVSQDAEICDGDSFILPDGTPVTTAGSYIITVPSSAGCDSNITTILNVLPTYTVPVAAEICANETYQLPDGQQVNTAGNYSTTLLTAQGCDSVINTALTVNPIYSMQANPQICEGETHMLPDGTTVSSAGTYQTMLQSASNCDSLITTFLTVAPVYDITVDAEICDGDTYILPDGTPTTSGGNYTNSFVSSQGCDSTINTNLVVLPTYNVPVSAAICDDQFYTLPDGQQVNTAGNYITTLQTNSGCDSIISTELEVFPTYSISNVVEICDTETYTLPDGTIVNTSGSYQSVFSTATDCDSTITTLLTVHPSYDLTEEGVICEGETFILPDGTSVTDAGTYTSNLVTGEGCDSIIHTTVTVNPVYNVPVAASICDNETYTLPDGQQTEVAGMYTTVLQTSNGCDSIIVTDLQVLPTYAFTVQAEICENETYELPDGSTVSQGGTYQSTFQTVNNCDSIITTLLTINPIYDLTESTEICDGEEYILPDGTLVTDEGVYTSSLTSENGCDSIIHTTVVVLPTYAVPVAAEICEGDTYTLPDGEQVNTTGNYTTTLLSVDGCDSIIQTDLIVHPTYGITNNAVICDNEMYTLPDGTEVNTGGTYQSVFQTVNNCDSIITTLLTVNQAFELSEDAEICEGETYILPDGEPALTSGVYTTVLTTVDNCDSTITTNLVVNPSYDILIPASICEGETYQLPDGQIVNTTGDYTLAFQTDRGCDSTIVVELTVNPSYSEQFNISICDDETYTLPDGSEVNTSGTYQTLFQTAENCDSLITINLTVNERYLFENDPVICDNETYTLPDGTEVNETGTYTTTFTTANNCDSTYITNLTVNESYLITDEVTLCEGETFLLPDGREVSESAIYTSEFITMSGCDSIIITDLTVNPSYNISKLVALCEGDSYVLPDGEIIDEPGQYVSSFITENGCDSIITSNVTINESFHIIERVTVCEDDGYFLPDGRFVDESGTYEIPLLSRFGCDSLVTIGLTVQPNEVVNYVIDACAGESIELPWGEAVNQAGTYTNTSSSSLGCSRVEIVDFREFNIDYPTAFSPNGDGQNDLFRGILISECEVTEYHLRVFNRWGEIVFETYTWNEGWDGVLNQENEGKSLFAWHAIYRIEGIDQEFSQVGGVTLIR